MSYSITLMPTACYDHIVEHIIAYGSLMNPASAARTLGYEPKPINVQVNGWRRTWTAVINNNVLGSYCCDICGGAPPYVASLNVERNSGSTLHALAYSIEDWTAMDERETGYERVLVTTIPSVANAYLYTTPASPVKTAVCSQHYYDIAVAAIGADSIPAPPRLRALTLTKYTDAKPTKPCTC